jgi:response regulator RpfG family c-di-GMP phosphodiesterase
MTASSTLRVLAVDDNSSLLRFLVSAFTANSCAVTPAPTAERALELIETEDFDLVVSDIKMPGLTGLDLLRAVKGRQPATPVVLITGAPSVNSAVFGLRHGAYDYLPKPFSIKEVQQLVERVRADRVKWTGQAPLPAGLAEELSRRQVSVEMLFRIADLALQTHDPRVFVEKVLQFTGESVRNDGALMLLRDEQGGFTTIQQGDLAVVDELRALLQSNFDRVLSQGGREALGLSRPGGRVDAVAAMIPGVGQSLGVLCIGRLVSTGAFLPDERDVVVGFAQATAVALQKLVLREDHERNLVDTITAFVNAIESKDPYLKGHSARVALYATEIAHMLKLDEEMIQVVSRGAMLHDLGKLSIMDTILRKPERLITSAMTAAAILTASAERPFRWSRGS